MMKRVLKSVIVGWLILQVVNTGTGFAKKPDHESEQGKNSGRKIEPKNPNEREGGCTINNGDISKFANGEAYNFNSVVQLVANPQCSGAHNVIAAREISQGVAFNKTPFHLNDFATGYSNLTIDGKRALESGIKKNVAATLRNNPLSSRELLPILGQLSLLSPKSARSMLAYLITQELVSQELEGKRALLDRKEPGTAIDTISTLKKFGAAEPLISDELAANVEDMASTSQADSLGKVLTGLALAARELEEFSPTFNSSASAFKRGVDKSVESYSDEERGSLLKAGFSAANASTGYSPSIEPGVEDINTALGMLLRGDALADTTLRNVWRNVIEVAAASPSQTALAQALALSLTTEAIYLPKNDRDKLLECGKIHSPVAVAMQEQFIEAWKIARSQLTARKMAVSKFNEQKKKFFEPWVSGMLDFDATSIKPVWVKEIVSRGLVKDEEIENKFPRFVLTLLTVRETASKKMVLEENLESTMASQIVNAVTLWDLTHTFIPALSEWAKKYDEE